MTPLDTLIRADIRANGPIPINQFMATALFHPEHGYYTTKPVFGRSGDFVTAPEISQMFGEMVGLALAQTWMDQDRPSPIQLVELGPGRGTLMADILRATRGIAGFHDAAKIILVEASDQLIAQQRETLAAYDVSWCSDVFGLADLPTFCIANEFFDALPIRQFQRIDTLWRERMVGIQGDALAVRLGGVVNIDTLTARLTETQDGDIVELCPSAGPIMAHLGGLIERCGGVAIIFDYGDWRAVSDTLQAIKNHEFSDPFIDIGASDITAHVDFHALVNVSPSRHTTMTPQGVWLERMGITARAQILAQSLIGDALENHIRAHRRLTHPEEMGKLFKTIALYPSTHSCPVGFEP